MERMRDTGLTGQYPSVALGVEGSAEDGILALGSFSLGVVSAADDAVELGAVDGGRSYCSLIAGILQAREQVLSVSMYRIRTYNHAEGLEVLAAFIGNILMTDGHVLVVLDGLGLSLSGGSRCFNRC